MREPIKLTLYDEKTNEPIRTLEQRIITLDMLKRAARLAELFDGAAEDKEPEKPNPLRRLAWWIPKPTRTDEQIDMLTRLVADFYGGQATPAELSKKADVPELITVVRAIMNSAGVIIEKNPTNPFPQKGTRKRR